MLQRCHNPKSKDYASYGARGVTVCDTWRGSFAAFLADMGPRAQGLSFDRLDNDGPYRKENCEWRSGIEQARNKRTNHLVEYQGELRPIVEWAERFGLSRALLRYRLVTGWSVDDALNRPASRTLNYRHHRSTKEPQ
jgi:hypothetical protein